MQADNQTVLALNCGSSSLKFVLFQMDGASAEPILEGEAEAIGAPGGHFSAHAKTGEIISQAGPIASHAEAASRVFALLDRQHTPTPCAVGHRIVHGGPFVRRHCLIDAAVLQALEAARAFAPLHAPAALEAVRAAQARFRALPHVACLDTAFHRGLPEVARRFPLAASLQAEGIERYGFHGLSCESILRQLGDDVPERLIIAHLGSGCSVTAVRAGRSADTSMGLTPSGGVMMATRSGDLDPGLVIYLMREKGMTAEAVEMLVDRKAGMAGVSGLSGDPRRLRQADQNADARLALRMFVYSVRKQIAAMAAVLEGLDLLVFTGGIGEHDAETRADIRAGLGWLGVARETASGERAASPDESRAIPVPVRILQAREEAQIARHAWSVATEGC